MASTRATKTAPPRPDFSGSLRCGLEIHQQLDTEKLFCSCRSSLRDDQPDILVERELRASAGEEGGVDIAAAAEQAKRKSYLYQAYSDTTCLVELDEEPPHPLNRDALGVALQVSRMLGMVPVASIQVMRKTVVDGSNTSGFQRTALVARNGVLKTAHGDVTIPTLCIEEDAAKIVAREAQRDVYNLSRLGIPLIEIATGPDITSPEMAREVALQLGMLLRSTGRAKRGLGTIRQDLNVSIPQGARIEIKGAQELDLLPKLVEMEALRQRNLLDIAAGLRDAKAGKPVDVSSVLKKSASKVIRAALDSGGAALACRMEGFAGMLGKEVQPGRRLGTELADHAKVMGVKGLFHSDELPAYGITVEEVAALRKALGCKEHDGFILIADAKERAERAMAAALGRAEQARSEVPREVRKANEDATTSFLRPMPGSSRMYPETDVRSIRVTAEMLSSPLPELLSSKEERFAKQLPRDLAHQLVWGERWPLYERAARRWPELKPVFVAETLVSAPKEIRKRHGFDLDASDADFELLFDAVSHGTIAQEAVFELLVQKAQGKPLDIASFSLLSDKELQLRLRAIVAANPKAPLNALMGIAMKELRGKADGKRIAALLQEFSG